MGKHSAWAVAAAIQLALVDPEYQREIWKCTDMAKGIDKTGLSGLRSKGGKTIGQTLGSAIAENALFDGGYGDNIYWLDKPKEALQNPQVQRALRDYISWLRDNDLEAYWCYHASENERLLKEARQEIAELNRKINALENRKPSE